MGLDTDSDASGSHEHLNALKAELADLDRLIQRAREDNRADEVTQLKRDSLLVRINSLELVSTEQHPR